MANHDPNVVVVGAGVGGLACAIDLAGSGFRVKVLERAHHAGGKARTVALGPLGGIEIDAGPTVLTMPWVFDELFERAGASFRAEVALERADILARHAWADGTRLDLHAERGRSADAIAQTFGPAEARAYLAFCDDGRRIYEIAEGLFLRAQRPTVASMARQFASTLSILGKLDAHRSMWSSLERRFASPRLRQLFGRYATYCGSSPFEAPATLNLVAHVESEGVYRAREGVRSLVASLERLARSLGVEFLYGHPVDRILVERGRATGVTCQDSSFAADAVVFNGDASALGAGLLGAHATKAAPVTAPGARSLSAVTWAMRARTSGFPLVRHNVFFSDDYPREFEAILRHGAAPDEPTVYVCAHERGDDVTDLPHESLLVLTNAPATGDDPGRWHPREKNRCTTVMMNVLRRMGLSVLPSESVQTTPAEFHRLFPGTGGALYGPRSRGGLSALSRQAAASKIPGLYLAGGSVHPGAGLPMAALSGRLAASKIREDHASTARSPRVATTGTISTG
jgi:1-hydroxycarotenoid 3,4-desaturase